MSAFRPPVRWLALLMFAAAGPVPAAAGSALDPLAEAVALQARIYGIPLEGMLMRLSNEVLDPATRKAQFNAYYHYRELATPTVSPFRAPNNDTLYSTAWVDLRREPAILTMPSTGGRYYTAQVLDMTTETIANFGQREHGTDAAIFAIVGPDWQGELPQGVKAVARSSTDYATVLLRLLVDGPAELPTVHALQSGFRIASLSRWRAGLDGGDPAAMEGLSPFRAKTPRERFAALDQLLRSDPIRPGEEALMEQFALIGFGPGESGSTLRVADEALARTEVAALEAAREAGMSAGETRDGWRLFRSGLGRYGYDFVGRASTWVGGPLANVVEESFYPSAVADANGLPLDGSKAAYVLTFPAGALPPARAFWSITMYDLATGALVANPIERYSIGNRTPGLRTAPDGSLTLYIQHASPPGDAAANWLPAPSGPFYMSLRLYGPGPDAMEGRWSPPPVSRR
jgi:hypothetical protein